MKKPIISILHDYGRYFYATGFIAFGIMHVIFGEFITGRAPAWPEEQSGQIIWAVLSGIVIIATGLSIYAGKGVRYAALLSAAIIFIWALVRHIPIAFGDPALGGAWTQFGKSVVFFSGVLAVAASYPKTNNQGKIGVLINAENCFIQLARFVLALYLILCGVQHFLFVEFVASLIPPVLPWPVFWTYFAGVCLIAGGTGMLIPVVTKLATLLSGLMIFSWVFIIHIPLAVSGFAGNDREWISVFEALAISGLAFYLAAVFWRKDHG